jgi:hypothetical protein
MISPLSVTSSLSARVNALWHASAPGPEEAVDGKDTGLSEELGLAREYGLVLFDVSVVERLRLPGLCLPREADDCCVLNSFR